jgi:hypothetical protein
LKKNFNTKFYQKNYIFKAEGNVPAGKIKEKNMKKKFSHPVTEESH